MEEMIQCQHPEDRRAWLSECCEVEGLNDAVGTYDAVGLCSSCRDWTGFTLVCENCGEIIQEEVES